MHDFSKPVIDTARRPPFSTRRAGQEARLGAAPKALQTLPPASASATARWVWAPLTALSVWGCAAPAPKAPDRPVAPVAVEAARAPAPGVNRTLTGPAAAPPSTTSADSAPTAASPGSAPTSANDDLARFVQWRTGFERQALAAGIRPETVRNVLGEAQWLPRVVELDRAQPEFTRTPWAYLDSAVSPQRIAMGKEKWQAQRTPLEAAASRYGVPASVITAIWGMESNYGSNFGNFRTVDALATLAAEGRRRSWAQNELLAALRIIDQGDIAPQRMLGSWAGAMGHTQFLPSVFLRHAVDADGDGHRDIWGSIPDVAASTGAFLAGEGWRRGETWGSEVTLPANFDYARTELSVRQSAQAWADQGVRTLSGQPLPALDMASILTPAGASGPAFLVGHNFRTLLRYNNAVTYALGVAFLAQQIEGGAPITAPWPRELRALSRQQVLALQMALNERGFDTGRPDGVLGPATRAGLRRYQQSIGQVPDGFATEEIVNRLVPRAPANGSGTARE